MATGLALASSSLVVVTPEEVSVFDAWLLHWKGVGWFSSIDETTLSVDPSRSPSRALRRSTLLRCATAPP